MRYLFLAAVTAALLFPVSAADSKPPPYSSGNYSGTTVQKNPNTHKTLSIKFTVSNGKIRKIKFSILENCGDGHRYLVTDSISGPATINSHQNFAFLVTYADGSQALFKGHLKGKKGSGTVGASDHPTPGVNCIINNVKWSAKH